MIEDRRRGEFSESKLRELQMLILRCLPVEGYEPSEEDVKQAREYMKENFPDWWEELQGSLNRGEEKS